MELKLKSFPGFMGSVVSIYREIMHGKFDILASNGLIGPSSAEEYRIRLDDLLMGRKLTEIPQDVIENGFVFKKDTENTFSIEIPFFVDGEESEIFGIFLSENENIYLYDILIP